MIEKLGETRPIRVSGRINGISTNEKGDPVYDFAPRPADVYYRGDLIVVGTRAAVMAGHRVRYDEPDREVKIRYEDPEWHGGKEESQRRKSQREKSRRERSQRGWRYQDSSEEEDSDADMVTYDQIKPRSVKLPYHRVIRQPRSSHEVGDLVTWTERTFVRAKVTNVVTVDGGTPYEKIYRVDKDSEDHKAHTLRRAYDVNERVEYRVGANWLDAEVLSISSPGVYRIKYTFNKPDGTKSSNEREVSSELLRRGIETGELVWQMDTTNQRVMGQIVHTSTDHTKENSIRVRLKSDGMEYNYQHADVKTETGLCGLYGFFLFSRSYVISLFVTYFFFFVVADLQVRPGSKISCRSKVYVCV